jgi:outer membrane protein assembly factor BamB
VDAAAGNALWEAELDGAVAGTPAFGHGTLCVPGLDGNVYLLDGSNGQTRGKWKTEMPGRDYAAILGQESASVTTDLVVDGEFLHYAGLDGQLYRVHLVKNALVSKTALPGPVRAGGLAVKGRIVVVTCATGELAAVQVGEPQNPLLWKVKVTNPGPDAFLIPPVIAGDTIIVATGRDRYLFARDILNGETTWGVQAPGRVVSLAADSSRVYVTGCSEDTRCALTALSLADGKEAWSIPLTSKTIGPPIVVNGLVVAGLSGGGGCLAAFDAKTGEPLWQGREFTGVSSPPVPYAGRIVVLTDAGYLAAYEPCDVVTDNAMLDAGETIQPPYFDSQGPITDLQWRFARWPQNPAKFVYRMTDFTFIFHPIDDAAPWRVVSKQMLPYEPFLLSPTYTGLLFPTGGGDNLRVIGVRGIDRQSQGFYDVAIRDRTRVLTALILARKLRGQWRPICVNNWFGAWRDDEPGVSDRFIAGYYVNKKRPFEVLTRLADRQALQLLTFFQRSLYLQAPADAVFRGSLVRDGQSPEMRIVVSHYWGRRPKDEQSRLLCGDPNQLMFLELAP